MVMLFHNRLYILKQPLLKTIVRSVRNAPRNVRRENRKKAIPTFTSYPSNLMEMALQTVAAQKQAKSPQVQQKFKYLLVLDFEATCVEGGTIEPQEIIEMPVLKLNTETQNVEAVFHEYIKPRVFPMLTPFCTDLTGITQEMVDQGIDIVDALKRFDGWMAQNVLCETNSSFAFVTFGDWDLKIMLPNQCNYFNIAIPGYFNQWINLKRSVSKTTGKYPRGMMQALEQLKIEHIGRHHSGIDDTKNIASMAVEIMRRGHMFEITGRK